MTERGVIRGLEGNQVTVAPDHGAACFGCMNMECKSGGGLITAENIFALPLETGQVVEVKAPPGVSLVNQALLALLPPGLSFTAGFILVRLIFPAAGEGAAAFTGLFLLFAAAFVVYTLREKKPAQSGYTVIKIVN